VFKNGSRLRTASLEHSSTPAGWQAIMPEEEPERQRVFARFFGGSGATLELKQLRRENSATETDHVRRALTQR
jgi:hypothetical protein